MIIIEKMFNSKYNYIKQNVNVTTPGAYQIKQIIPPVLVRLRLKILHI